MKNLCQTCRQGTVVVYDNRAVDVECDALRGRVSRPVVTCTDYRNRAEVRLGDMYQIAWVLETSEKHSLGFVPYHAWEMRHPNEELLPGRV